ncbi:SDR family oxidoreductase [Ferribacterium limneticum]|uniref:SDR family oxidoreductase n=1 Tax=Ferribacterium limneticum TaxID=76259 RepID=UPI001CFC2426|nr:SDR family oxidoreductase [Ferribacterium limneticum]UCV28187.1 SDR family oxidoreductase [Ferribacterium limneticum]UCV32104.1 SDR family oxidoreductase [Ferribacterium limneticum]
MTLRVFITGASSGIGEALAVYYAAQGATLGLVARRADFLDGLNARLGGGHACYPLDVTDAPALHDAATDFMQRFGAPHIVIANAGVSAGTLTEYEEDLAIFRRVMDTNVFGMAATFAPFIPAMKAVGGDRRLVGIASVAGIRGLPGAEAYSASKAAAITYLESLRLEMRPCGIKVVTIAPGYIETPMTAINPYRMPFLLPVERAAERFAATIARGTSYAVIPWQMGVVAKLLRVLPNWLYDRLFTDAPRKPRGLLK